MGNKAQQELQGLLNMQSAGESAAANLTKLEEARTGFQVPSDGEASFALPEALATTIGAGWLLGPAGGLLLGIAQGILGKKEEQAALDQYAGVQDALGITSDVIFSELETMALTANPEEFDAIRGLQARVDGALAASTSPLLADRSLDMLNDVYAEITAIQTRSEEQRIEAEVRDRQATRDLEKQQKSDWMSLLDDYDRQSANYEQTMLAGNQALEMIERGNPVDIAAALINVNKTLDPTSVVRPEEAKALIAGGDLLEQAQRKLGEWAGSGLPLKADDRAELIELVQGLQKQATGFQMQRDVRFQDRAVKLDLPSDYVQEFRRVKELPVFKPTGMQQKMGEIEQRTAGVMDWLAENASDQALLNRVAHTVGLDSYEPRSIEEQAKTNPRVRRATQ